MGLFSCRLYTYDKSSKQHYLVDTGADVSVIPANVHNKNSFENFKLQAANSTSIRILGTKILNLDLGLRRTWTFIIAEIQRPILGADFLREFGLLVDIRKR